MEEAKTLTRGQLIALLRKQQIRDISYRTLRGYVSSYAGWAVEGNEFLLGYPSRGSAERLTAHGWIERVPLASVPTTSLANAACSLGLISYADCVRVIMAQPCAAAAAQAAADYCARRNAPPRGRGGSRRRRQWAAYRASQALSGH